MNAPVQINQLQQATRDAGSNAMRGRTMMHTTNEQKALQKAVLGRSRYKKIGSKLPMEKTRFPCPHCKVQSTVRNSQMVSDTMRESVYQCTNVECGHTFKVTSEVTCTLSPSATPDPSVNLPLSTHVRRDMMRVVLENAGESDHQAQFTTPITGDLFAGDKPAGASS